MDRLWAPWRMEYIEKADEDGCFLCEGLASTEDRKNLILFRGAETFVVMNRYPYNSAHLMIAPKQHTSDILGLTNSCKSEILELSARSMNILKELFGCEGFNCGINIGRIAGAGLKDHVHLHVVPRWPGDTNFMPVFADVKSIPEFLEQTYDRLISSFAKL